MTLPDDSALLRRPERYLFGDDIAARDTRATIAAMDLLEPVYAPLRTDSRQLPGSVSPNALRAEVGGRLNREGWAEAPELAHWRHCGDSYAFGWRKDGHVYALVGLGHRPGETASSPVNILSDVGDPSDPL